MPPKGKLKPTDLKLLAIRTGSLGLNATVEDLRKLSPDISSNYVAVVDDNGHPVGIVERDDTPAHVPQPEPQKKKGLFGKSKKAPPDPGKAERSALIRDRMHEDPLIIEHGTATDVVMDEVFKRQGERFLEDLILVREDGTYFGLISASAIFRLLYGFLGSHMTELRVQKEQVVVQHSQVVRVRRDLELTNQKLEIARDKALEGERMKNSFLANMSHEIRTPMNGVFGMIDLLNDTQLSGEQEELLMTARSSAEMLMRIIDDILDFSKIEAGMVGVEFIAFKLTDTVESSLALYAEAAGEKEIELSLVFEDAPEWVTGDPHRYQQVLNNLISNAIKFTDSGKVEVSVSGVATEQGTGILTEVSDTGIGISSDKIEDLFKPFTQADESTVRKYGGTGLGLSISSNLVELMGGKLECDSKLDKGTHFAFVLPFEHNLDDIEDEKTKVVTNRTTCSRKLSDRTDFSGMRALLVEDNIVNQEVAKGFLHKLNCDVVTAENGQVALEYLMTDNFDCVFMDCQMPVMDGFGATEQIRGGKVRINTKDIFISAMTAHAMSGDREKCLHVGMDHYFSKPFGLHDFRKALVLASEKAEKLYRSEV